MLPIRCNIRVLSLDHQRTEKHAMGETLPLFTPLLNKSVHIESRPEHLSAESGALIQLEIMERSGIIDWLAERLHDPRKPELITYRL